MAYSKDKVAVITGAGSGIGRALAQQLNREGCRLLLCDISEEGLNETLSSLSDKSVAAHGRILDIARKVDVQAWAAEIAEQYGAIDILVNNAGVATGATVEDSKYEDIEWLMGINFWGVVYGTKEFLPLLRKSSQGHLVNISSIFGMMSVPTQSAYNAAKFAVRGYTEALRHEMEGSNVHVCCVHPGGIKTNIVRNARITDPSSSQKDREEGFDKAARTTPESAAAQIIAAIEKRKKRLMIGMDAKIMSLIIRLFPVHYLRFVPGLSQIGNKENE